MAIILTTVVFILVSILGLRLARNGSDRRSKRRARSAAKVL